MLHVVYLFGYRNIDVSLIHAKVAKVLEQNKLGRDVTI